MALSFATGMTSIASGDSTSNYDATRFSGSGSAPGIAAADDFVQGSGAIQSKLAGNNWNSAVLFDYYTANGSTVLNLTTTGNEVLCGWFRYGLKSKTLAVGSGGMYLIVSSSTETGTSNPTVYSEWYLGGNDFYPVGPSGWYFFMVDTRKTPSTTTGGGASLSSVRRLGIGIRNDGTVGTAKGEPFYLDAMWYGRPNYKLTGDGTLTADWDDFITDSESTNQNGLIQDIGGAYHLRCGIQFGDASQSNTTTFSDATGKIFIFKRVLYHTSSAFADSLNYGDYYTLQAVGAAAQKTSVTFGSVLGTGSDRQGVLGGALRSEDTTNITWNVDFQTDIADLSALKLYGLTMHGAKGGILLDNDAGGTLADLISCFFVNCGEIDPGPTGRGSTVLNSTLIDPLGGTAANRGLRLRYYGASNDPRTTGLSCITSGTPTTQHMIHLPDSGTFTIKFDGIIFFGDYSSGTLWHGELSNATQATITANASNGSNPSASEFDKTGHASSTITVDNPVTITFTGMKDSTEVRVYKVSDGSEVAGTENATDGSPDDRSFGWSAQASLAVNYVIHNVDYETIRVNNYTVPGSDGSIPIQQRLDRNYANP